MIDFSPITLDALNLIFALLVATIPVVGAWLFKMFKSLKLEEKSFGLIKEKQFSDWLTQAAVEGVGYAEEWAHKKVLDASKVEVRNEMALMGARFMLKQYPETVKYFKENTRLKDEDLVTLIMSYMFTPSNEKAIVEGPDVVKEMYPSASDGNLSSKKDDSEDRDVYLKKS